MINFKTGKPNARYWVLKMIKDNFHPGDKLVASDSNALDVIAQGFDTPQGKKVLLVNKSNSEKTVTLSAEFEHSTSLTIDEETGDDAPRAGNATGHLKLAPYAVTVLTAQ
jgi:hypothetical protein